MGSWEGRSAGVQKGGGAPAFPCMCLGFLLSPTLCFLNPSAPVPGAWDGHQGGRVWERWPLFERPLHDPSHPPTQRKTSSS